MLRPAISALTPSIALSLTTLIIPSIFKISTVGFDKALPDSIGLLESISVGLLVFTGTYAGLRTTSAQPKAPIFTRMLVGAYVFLGAVLSLPMHSHAVKLDMPRPGASFPKIDFLGNTAKPFLTGIGGLLLMILVPMLLTKIIAAACSSNESA